ncbi:hypothetical protein C8J55DRAFT_69771 [Lentinula edodes]|uniref:Uncharacterized protein n=1 Tax=Lentinula lateritia TaxID=40482 RepID=A0A9W9DQM3_9AGAR|nr:hypothetical protein C8J55DRAFT_69771 [Lentinula edodes]
MVKKTLFLILVDLPLPKEKDGLDLVVVVNILPFIHFSFFPLCTFHTFLILHSIHHPLFPHVFHISPHSHVSPSVRFLCRPHILLKPLFKGSQRSEILNSLSSIFFAYFFFSRLFC